jgi:hypothetical protein
MENIYKFIILIGILIIGYTEIWFLDKIFSFQVENTNKLNQTEMYVCK